MLGLNLTSLLSVSKKKEREKALAEFKDRNSDVQVLYKYAGVCNCGRPSEMLL